MTATDSTLDPASQLLAVAPSYPGRVTLRPPGLVPRCRGQACLDARRAASQRRELWVQNPGR